MAAEYAFILTFQRPTSNGYNVATLEGAIETTQGMTRRTALVDIANIAKERYAIPADAPINILFFSLEPNRLGGA